MNASGAIAITGAMVLTCWCATFLAFRRPLLAFWREPVFNDPIAIIESDDWGAGPTEQAQALCRLSALLAGFRNKRGERPVMTLGVVLETLDRDATRASGEYAPCPLGDPRQAANLAALQAGEASGVFSLQLHGQAHYWPDTVMALRESDRQVAAWLAEPGLGWTESLPAVIQSRWLDGRRLPSQALPSEVSANAASTEAASWRDLFGCAPRVAVPTTFIWSDAVERGWACGGVRVIVTPGKRSEGRGADGTPTDDGRVVVNGERSEYGAMYLVRDIYFEPSLGHVPARLQEGVLDHAVLGRPALIETHRFNFCGPLAVDTAYDTLSEALEQLLRLLPTVRFMSTAALAEMIERRDPDLLDHSPRRRLAVWARRATRFHPFARWARLVGMMLPLRVLGALA